MNILIAEDDPTTRRLIELTLRPFTHDLIVCTDGCDAFSRLNAGQAPLAVLDWMMPGLDGIDVCRRLRAGSTPVYLILLTANTRREDVVTGFEAGADDYVSKPFDPAELRARVQVGERLIGLQSALARRVHELEEALARVNELQGLLPICSYCKKIRDDQNYWAEVETYLAKHSGVQFTHSICPGCYHSVVRPAIAKLT